MDRRGSFVGGIILVLLGALFLAAQLIPGIYQGFSWPVIIIGLGAIFLIAAAISRVGPLAVPACILAGIGGILYYQNLTGNWETWSYVWTLIPGFVGVGILLAGLLSPRPHMGSGGWTLILISLIMFFIFGGAFGLGGEVSKYWPVLLIVLGLIALVRALFGRRH